MLTALSPLHLAALSLIVAYLGWGWAAPPPPATVSWTSVARSRGLHSPDASDAW